tara:strand:- start:1134 stop:2855 length:1722 start_codon:yes stop_codon:yes gene_type:complete
VARQRVQTKYAANQVRLTPQASPVNTYVQPARNDQISKALDAVTGNVSRAAAKTDRAKEQSKAAEFQIQKLMAQEAAYNDGSLGDWEKVKEGLSLAGDPQYGAALQVAYNQKIGAEAGLDIQSALFKWNGENPNLRQSDPEAYSEQLDAITKKLLTPYLGPDSVNSVGYQSSMRNQVSAAQNQLKSQQVSEYTVAQAKIPLENYQTQLSANVNTAYLETEGLTNAERISSIGEAVSQTLQATFGTKTIPPRELNAATTDYLITLATEQENLDILDIAKSISTGNGGYLYGIVPEMKKLINAQKTLAGFLDSKEAAAYAMKRREETVAKDEYLEAAYTYYGQNNNFEDFEAPESSKVLGDYDIASIQDKIRQFKESPILTKSHYDGYYDIFNGVTELTVDRGNEMLEGMKPESLAEYRLAKSAMGDVLQGRSSVFTGESYKSVFKLIEKKFNIDPQKGISIGQISIAAQDEFNRTEAEFLQRVTSYIVDPSTLDKDLMEINRDALVGTSLHSLDRAVKYELYRKIAEKAIQDNFTDINNKGNGVNGTVLQPTANNSGVPFVLPSGGNVIITVDP